MTAALIAGCAYFASVFAVGFVLGAVRVLLLSPHLGETASVALELPIILGVSWLVCGRLLGWLAVPDRAPARLAMGASAFALLMAAELLVAVLAFGRSVDEHLAAYQTVAAALGLAAQLVFAAFPLIRMALAPARGFRSG